jgi:hypothetical protein
MIDITTLRKEDAHRLVIYTDGTGDTEEGHITSWNDTFIFVDYGNSCGRGIATSPYDLKWTMG